MAPTLGAALVQIFGGAPPPGTTSGQKPGTEPGVTRATAALIAKANAQYDAAQVALRRGDLSAFGREIRALGRTLSQLKAAP
jgi:uncharacterized membrane protein (UPF0182 family)